MIQRRKTKNFRLETEQITSVAGVPTIFRMLSSWTRVAESRLEHPLFVSNAGRHCRR
jgi:hypothetical protein